MVAQAVGMRAAIAYLNELGMDAVADHEHRLTGYTLARLREIADLSAQGLSLEGIRRVLDLQEEVRVLRLRLEEFRRTQASTSLVVWRPNTRNR